MSIVETYQFDGGNLELVAQFIANRADAAEIEIAGTPWRCSVFAPRLAKRIGTRLTRDSCGPPWH